ncbi:MAG TPA: hypothetical protein VKT25_02570 [Ktedonobacteraceae bacterium]|nr:hypothetical protein [Ktedonobacteraceae bacterium]
MKVAALALVLIVASAVVLIFANTLNSWVVGGLIGGLAALLISIPISLIIFSSMARRHDELVFAQAASLQEDDAYDEYEEIEGPVQYDEYGRAYRTHTEVYEAEAYILPNRDEVYDDEYDYDAYDTYGAYEDQRLRHLPEARRLPAPGQGSQGYASPAHPQQPVNRYPDGYRRATRALPAPQERTRTPSGKQTGHQRQPRQGQTTRSLRSQQQAAALRAARREAEQEYTIHRDISVTAPRRVTTPRRLPTQSAQLRRPQQRDETGAMQPPARQTRREVTGDLVEREAQTDALRNRLPTTGSMRMNPDTGKIVRNPQIDEEYSTSETWTGSMQNPLVRRAPYLYEDDPMREQFAQQIEKPLVRRSSRYLHPEEEQE